MLGPAGVGAEAEAETEIEQEPACRRSCLLCVPEQRHLNGRAAWSSRREGRRNDGGKPAAKKEKYVSPKVSPRACHRKREKTRASTLRTLSIANQVLVTVICDKRCG